MGAILMNAGIMTAIILSLVGLIKLPFNKFKEKHPKTYKAVFTMLSIVLTFGVCLLNQAFVLVQPLFNTNFVIMLIATLAGVLFVYNGIYEGLSGKELFKRLSNALKNLKASAPENKLSKMIDKVGIDVALNILNSKQLEVQSEVVKVENAVVENQVINAEHIEIKNN